MFTCYAEENYFVFLFSSTIKINLKMKIILLILLISVALASITILQELGKPVQDGDLAFLRALNNYFGCKSWSQGECTECSLNFVFNDNQICREVSPQCQKFNRAIGICERCYLGFQVYDGQCIISKIAQSIDRGCKSFQDGKCKQCSARWYFTQNNVCQPVDDNCRKWEDDGKCTGCYHGYYLSDEKCLVSPLKGIHAIDNFCAEWDGLTCKKCAQRAYFGPIGFCIPVSDYCRTWDLYDGYCLTCYQGYILVEGKCLQEEQLPPPQEGCSTWDWNAKICLECSERWVFNEESVCIHVSDDCKQHNEKGQCLSCYDGYQQKQGHCILIPEDPPADLGCKDWNWQEKKCLKCSHRWFFNQEGSCIPVSDQCKQVSDNDGKCTQCYGGYKLKDDGECQMEQLPQVQDPGCRVWDWDQSKCTQCSFRWYFDQKNKCQRVDDHCKDYNEKGECTDCYPGNEVKEGKCIQIENDYCQKREDEKCVKCLNGYRLMLGKCVLSNPLCQEVDENGRCKKCYSSYILFNNICVPLSKLVSIYQYYLECCPDKLVQLKEQGRIL